MTTEAQQLLDAAFSGTLNLDADASQAIGASEADTATQSASPTDTTIDTAQQSAAPAQDEPEGAPIASKSGGYTIPYEKLTQARTERDALKAERDALQAQLAQLTATQANHLEQAHQEAQDRADAGATPTQADQNLATAQHMLDNGADASLFGDFSEEGIAKGIAKSVQQEVQRVLAAEKAEATRQTQAQQQESAAQTHQSAIYQAHPDASQVYESAEFAHWVKAMPGYMQAGVTHAMQQGSTQDVIDVFSRFKADKGIQAVKPASVSQPVSQPAADDVPYSLSSLPGAAPAGTTEAERALSMTSDPAALLNHFMGMSADKQTRLMNSVL